MSRFNEILLDPLVVDSTPHNLDFYNKCKNIANSFKSNGDLTKAVSPHEFNELTKSHDVFTKSGLVKFINTFGKSLAGKSESEQTIIKNEVFNLIKSLCPLDIACDGTLTRVYIRLKNGV